MEDRNKQAPVHIAPQSISTQDVAKLMAARGVSAIVVVDDQTPVGIVTSRDIVARTIATRVDAAKVPVGAIMSSPLVTIPEHGTAHDAIALMERHGIRRLPVVDEAGSLVTLLTLDDLLRRSLADTPSLPDIVPAPTRRAGDGAPATPSPTPVRFADVPLPPRLSHPALVRTIRGTMTKPVMVRMVQRKPLHRFTYSAKKWCLDNRLLLALFVGLSIVGVAITFYVSAFYGYSPAYYEPKEGAREIQIKQKELHELEQKHERRDPQDSQPAR